MARFPCPTSGVAGELSPSKQDKSFVAVLMLKHIYSEKWSSGLASHLAYTIVSGTFLPANLLMALPNGKLKDWHRSGPPGRFSKVKLSIITRQPAERLPDTIFRKSMMHSSTNFCQRQYNMHNFPWTSHLEEDEMKILAALVYD
jgi:hypothetical protein